MTDAATPLTPALAARLDLLVQAYPAAVGPEALATAAPKASRSTNRASGYADHAANVYVWRLRRALGPDAILTVDGGYRLADDAAQRLGAWM